MQFKNVICFFTIIIVIQTKSQNLVNNGRFEIPITIDTCQYVNTLIDPPYWPRIYTRPFYYINPSRKNYICGDIHEGSKHLIPFEGKGFVTTRESYKFDGMKKLILYYSAGNPTGGPTDYGVHQKLIQPLKKDSWYVVSYRYKMGFDRDEDSVGYMYRVAFSHFGILFSVDTPPAILNLFRTKDEKYDPYLQDTILDTSFRWRLVERIYKADSNYNFISLARFTNITQSKYRLYFDKNIPGWTVRIFNQLDDVRLLPLDKYLRVSPDTTLCISDTIKLIVKGGAGPYEWRRASIPSVILSSTAELDIKVDTTTLIQVMSPYDTASIIVYIDSPKYKYDTIGYKTCENEPLKISSPDIYLWHDNSLDTSKILTNSGNYWYLAKTNQLCLLKRTQLDIKINSNKYDTLIQTSCDSFTYKSTTYKNSGHYSFPYKTIHGCDSLQTLALTLNNSYFQASKINSCAAYRWLDSLYTQTGKYQRKMKTVHQCDSLAELDLTIGLDRRVRLENGIHYTALQDSVRYEWYRCNPWRRITNETKRTFTTKTRGSYAVVLDNGKGCRDTSDCIELYSSALINPAQAGVSMWSVFPNPFSDELIIDLGKDYKEVSVKMYDLTGRLISNQVVKNHSTLKINNSKLPSGVYYLQIETESQNQFFNIRKE